jgi:multisubunit Na+/H+ antiporter MnhB subunit
MQYWTALTLMTLLFLQTLQTQFLKRKGKQLMRNFLAALATILFAAWLGAAFAFAMLDTSFTEWVGEFQQHYFHTKGN